MKEMSSCATCHGNYPRENKENREREEHKMGENPLTGRI